MPIDEILQQIRSAIVDGERKKYFRQFWPSDIYKHKKFDEDVFVLSPNMMVNREDIPYQLGVWTFDDVAKKMVKKYKHYFYIKWHKMHENAGPSNVQLLKYGRVSVKENFFDADD
jgi:hypothetical protein